MNPRVRKSRQSSGWVRLGMVGWLLGAAWLPNATALDCDGGLCLPPIEVWGMRFAGEPLYFRDSFQSLSQVDPGYNPFRLSMSWEEYFVYQEMIDQARTDRNKMADVRCNPLASGSTQATSSQSSPIDRYLAAHQLATSMLAFNGAWGMRAVIGGNVPVSHLGSVRPAFVITFADGKQETYAVAYGYGISIFEQPAVLGSQGVSVVPKPC